MKNKPLVWVLAGIVIILSALLITHPGTHSVSPTPEPEVVLPIEVEDTDSLEYILEMREIYDNLRPSVYASISLFLGDGASFVDFAKEYINNSEFYDELGDNEWKVRESAWGWWLWVLGIFGVKTKKQKEEEGREKFRLQREKRIEEREKAIASITPLPISEQIKVIKMIYRLLNNPRSVLWDRYPHLKIIFEAELAGLYEFTVEILKILHPEQFAIHSKNTSGGYFHSVPQGVIAHRMVPALFEEGTKTFGDPSKVGLWWKPALRIGSLYADLRARRKLKGRDKYFYEEGWLPRLNYVKETLDRLTKK